MTKSLKLFTQSGLLLIVILFIATIKLSRASSGNMLTADDDDDADTDVQEQRRAVDLNRLRNYLLTSNAGERAAKREQQEFHKRELIREYLQSISDPDPNRFQEVKKRFKTYCNSYEDLMHSNWAACG